MSSSVQRPERVDCSSAPVFCAVRIRHVLMRIEAAFESVLADTKKSEQLRRFLVELIILDLAEVKDFSDVLLEIYYNWSNQLGESIVSKFKSQRTSSENFKLTWLEDEIVATVIDHFQETTLSMVKVEINNCKKPNAWIGADAIRKTTDTQK